MIKLFIGIITVFTLMFNVTAHASTVTIDPTALSWTGKVDAGGFGLYVDVEGVQTDKPTVIFDNGDGDDHTVWQQGGVQQAIAQYTRTVTYDRAGVGQSDKSPNLVRDSINMMTELHTMLQNAGLKPPYIFVGHSLGGLNAREFAYLFPGEVKGYVFVDSAHEDQYTEMFGPLGVAFESLDNYTANSIETTDYDMQRTYSEVKGVRQYDLLRSIPITVLSATKHGPDALSPILAFSEPAWANMQADLATLSNNSIHITLDNTGHYIQLEQPQVVIDQIVNMFSRI